jgi:predicted N-acetyltransferase YhbS
MEIAAMPDIQIVDLRDAPQHIPQLAAWHHEQWSYLNPGQTLDHRIDHMRGHLEPAQLPRTFIAIAEHGLPMGSASLVAHDMDTHPELTPWLASVFVAPIHRHKGIGAALVRHAMHAASQAGIATLWLFTPDQERLYGRLGWSTVAREPYHGAEVTIMRIDFERAAPARGR